MINNLSTRCVKKLLSKGIINEEEKELYLYGVFMLLSQITYSIFTLLVGLLIKCLFESIVFYLSFQSIRKYAGGYHASTELRCQIISTGSIMLCLTLIKELELFDFNNGLLLITVPSALCILALSPLDTPEKPLTHNEFRRFRKISLLILLLISVLVVISYIFELKRIFAPSCLSLILESVLISAGKIKQLHSKKHAEQ